MAELLKEHWLFGIECHHQAKTDQSICACGLKFPERESVGKAVQDWIDHISNLANLRAIARESAQDPASKLEALREGIALVESAFAHVSHGGPTRAEAEAWLTKARKVVAE